MTGETRHGRYLSPRTVHLIAKAKGVTPGKTGWAQARDPHHHAASSTHQSAHHQPLPICPKDCLCSSCKTAPSILPHPHPHPSFLPSRRCASDDLHHLPHLIVHLLFPRQFVFPFLSRKEDSLRCSVARGAPAFPNRRLSHLCPPAHEQHLFSTFAPTRSQPCFSDSIALTGLKSDWFLFYLLQEHLQIIPPSPFTHLQTCTFTKPARLDRNPVTTSHTSTPVPCRNKSTLIWEAQQAPLNLHRETQTRLVIDISQRHFLHHVSLPGC